jgi:hypothetical protein
MKPYQLPNSITVTSTNITMHAIPPSRSVPTSHMPQKKGTNKKKKKKRENRVNTPAVKS